MSQEVISLEEIDNTEPFGVGLDQDSSLGAIAIPDVRDQARQIIGSVLGGPHKTDTEAAARLRLHVAAHPAEPERALLEHLMETGRMNRSGQQHA